MERLRGIGHIFLRLPGAYEATQNQILKKEKLWQHTRIIFCSFCHTKFLIIFVSPFRKSRDSIVRAQIIKQPVFDSLVLNVLSFLS